MPRFNETQVALWYRMERPLRWLLGPTFTRGKGGLKDLGAEQVSRMP